MVNKVVVYGFETSNNMKVRVALGFKGIDYEFRSIEPRDRADLVRVSGQNLTPVLVHGGCVLFDSAAILRYLDANFPGTPKLFGDSHRQQWEIEDWELFARTELAAPMMDVVHRRVYGEAVDADLLARAENNYAAATGKLAAQLADRRWLVSDAMTAADITAAATVFRIRAAKFFALPAVDAALSGWVERVMRYDRGA
jgi:glutathione S-transferase